MSHLGDYVRRCDGKETVNPPLHQQ